MNYRKNAKKCLYGDFAPQTSFRDVCRMSERCDYKILSSTFEVKNALWHYFNTDCFLLSLPWSRSAEYITSRVASIFYKGFDQKKRNWKHPPLNFVQYLEIGVIRDTKFGMSVSNGKFLNTAKCEVNSFYRCGVIRRKKQVEGHQFAPSPRLWLNKKGLLNQ